MPNKPEEHLRRGLAFNLLVVHIRTPHSTKVVRIGPFVERLVPWWYHSLSVIIKPLQHRVYNVWLVLSLVHVLTRIIYDVKQTRPQLTRTLRWGFGWFTASNYSIFQSRGSDRVIWDFDSGRSIPPAPAGTWKYRAKWTLTSPYLHGGMVKQDFSILLSKHEGRAGEYWPQLAGTVRTDRV